MLEFQVSKEYERLVFCMKLFSNMWRTLWWKQLKCPNLWPWPPWPWLQCFCFCLRHFYTIFSPTPSPISLLVETVTGVLSSTIWGVKVLVVDGWGMDKISAAWQCPIIPTIWWLEEMEDLCGYGICARISVFEQSKRTAHVLRYGSVLLHYNEFLYNFSIRKAISIIFNVKNKHRHLHGVLGEVVL